MDLNIARKAALDLVEPLDWEQVELGSALGRVVAEPVSAGRDMPGNPRSKWDGFALISADSLSADPRTPVILEIAHGETAAGHKPDKASSGMCYRIMTGAVLPVGADTVIPIEESTPCERGIIFTLPLKPGSGVIAAGSEARREDILLHTGDVLTPTRLALAAATGIQAIRVIRRPQVAILATGDELMEAGCSEESASIFCNNTHLFAGLVHIAGGEPIQLGAVSDNPEIIYSRLEKVKADMVITTGGMGKGNMDFIAEVWKKLGLETLFDRLNLSPGKGSGMATGNGRIFLGLPGNPRAGRIVYEEIAAPMIRRFLGLKTCGILTLGARSLSSISKKEGNYQAFEGILEMTGPCCSFLPNTAAKEHRSKLTFLRNGLAYSILPPEITYVAKGETIEVKLPDFALADWSLFHSKSFNGHTF